MGRLERRERNKNKKVSNSVVAIGCEGKNKTEKIYFENYNSRNCRIKFSTGNNTDPVGMANNLVNFIKNEDIKTSYGDKIYLVLDTDLNKLNEHQIKQAKEICNKYGIELITSTPTFEIWYILHFGYTTKKFQSSVQVKNEMKKKIENYSENMDVFKIIENNTLRAIENAKKIEKYQTKNNILDFNNEKCNPYTGVYKVVEELIKRNRDNI